MIVNLGDFKAGTVVRFMWGTNGADGASITRATAGTLRVYKDGSATERTSAAGITDTTNFDSVTGVHFCAIDLNDNTDAGFYSVGADYHVVLVGAVIDGKTVNTPLAKFSIQRHSSWLVDEIFTTTMAAIATRTGIAFTAKTLMKFLRTGLPLNRVTTTATEVVIRNDDDTANAETRPLISSSGRITEIDD